MIWQIVQGLGALVGLISGCYLLLDRWSKLRPSVTIVAKQYKEWGPRDAYLRIRNHNDRPMLLHFRGGLTPNQFVPVVDEETESILHSVMEGVTTFVLDGGATHDFGMMPPPNIDLIDPENEMTVSFQWEFAQPVVWRGKMTATRSIQKRRYTQLVEGRSRDWEEAQ